MGRGGKEEKGKGGTGAPPLRKFLGPTLDHAMSICVERVRRMNRYEVVETRRLSGIENVVRETSLHLMITTTQRQ